MQRNKDESIVSLDVDMYRELVAMAKTSKQYTTGRIERHARKMNPHLQPEHQTKVRERERFISKGIRQARKLIETTRNKIVYVETSVRSYGPLTDLVFTAMRVKCITRNNRHRVDVFQDGINNPNITSATTDCIHHDLPDDYCQITSGLYRTLWVKKWSPIHMDALMNDAQDEDFERTEYKRKMTLPINTDPKRYVARLSDVIGEA